MNMEPGRRDARDIDEAGVSETSGSPFSAGSVGRPRAARWALYAGIPLAAIAVVYLATRKPTAADEETGHAHGAVAASDTGRPVALSDAEGQRIGVTYAVATLAQLRKEIRTVGQVTFDETRVRSISPKIDGWVERLYVDFTGQYVAAGAPLFSVYSPMLVQAQEELLLAKRLQADIAGGSQNVRADATELLTSARRRLAYWDVPASDIARIEATGTVQRAITLRSPVGGFVVEKNVLQGQRIMAGDQLYKVADLGTVWVEGEVFEQDLSSVRLGQRAVAEVEAVPGEEFPGRITYVYPTVNPETRTARVRVELANPRLRLKPGMYATLRLTGTSGAVALTVPRTAVLSTGERNLVFVKRPDGKLEPRLVELGATTDDRLQILQGLAAGDTVVASATFLVDAESNLGTTLGGMGNMPGMDMTAPTRGDTPVKVTPAPRDTARPRPGGADHSGHED